MKRPYPLRDHRHYSYADYRNWTEDLRYELIDGAAFLMAPAPTVDHQTLFCSVGQPGRSGLARDSRRRIAGKPAPTAAT